MTHICTSRMHSLQKMKTRIGFVPLNEALKSLERKCESCVRVLLTSHTFSRDSSTLVEGNACKDLHLNAGLCKQHSLTCAAGHFKWARSLWGHLTSKRRREEPCALVLPPQGWSLGSWNNLMGVFFAFSAHAFHPGPKPQMDVVFQTKVINEKVRIQQFRGKKAGDFFLNCRTSALSFKNCILGERHAIQYLVMAHMLHKSHRNPSGSGSLNQHWSHKNTFVLYSVISPIHCYKPAHGFSVYITEQQLYTFLSTQTKALIYISIALYKVYTRFISIFLSATLLNYIWAELSEACRVKTNTDIFIE